MPLPTPNENESEEDFISRCMGNDTTNEDFPDQEQRAAVCYRQWRENKATDTTAEDNPPVTDSIEDTGPDLDSSRANALKAVSRTDDELRVGNHLVLWGTRDLEGYGSPRINPDGSKGEWFSPDTVFDSAYTKSGVVFVDWEHAQDVDPETKRTVDEVLGVVDWKTAKATDRGLWVEHVLNRRSQYVRWVEQLIEQGLIGSSSEAVPDEVEKTEDGKIVRWPLKRDTFTVQPMEFRNMKEFGPNELQAFKALGIPVPDDTEAEPEGEPEAAPEDATDSDERSASVAAARLKARCQYVLVSLMEE